MRLLGGGSTAAAVQPSAPPCHYFCLWRSSESRSCHRASMFPSNVGQPVLSCRWHWTWTGGSVDAVTHDSDSVSAAALSRDITIKQQFDTGNSTAVQRYWSCSWHLLCRGIYCCRGFLEKQAGHRGKLSCAVQEVMCCTYFQQQQWFVELNWRIGYFAFTVTAAMTENTKSSTYRGSDFNRKSKTHYTASTTTHTQTYHL